MVKSSKFVAAKRGRVLLVRRRRDRLWMFPGGRRRGRETEKDCLRREIREELPKLKLGRLKLWKEVKSKNPRSGRKMNDAIFIASKASGYLAIGDKKEIDKATWRKPRGIRLTPTSRYIRNKLFPKRKRHAQGQNDAIDPKRTCAAMTQPDRLGSAENPSRLVWSAFLTGKRKHQCRKWPAARLSDCSVVRRSGHQPYLRKRAMV